MSGDPSGRRPLLIALALVALGLLLHLPGIGRPFGVHEISGGNYFGVFARNFERLGLWELGGVPVGPVLFDQVDERWMTAYLSHPPGLFWLNAVVGADEARLRLLSALGHIATAILTLVIFRRLLGLWPATLAALVTLAFPVLAFFAIVSYESVVLPLGLGMLIAYQRAQTDDARARKRSLAVLGALAFIGPWMDWQFLFFCAGLAALAWGPWRAMVQRLWWPAACSTLAVALIFIWRIVAGGRWSKSDGPEGGVGTLLANTVGTRPAVGEFFGGFGQRALECFTSPAVLLALAGLWWLGRRAPRLTAALTVVGLMNAIVFPTHTMTHTLYLAYLAPLLAGALAAAAARTPRPAAIVLGAIVVGVAAWSTLDTRRLANTPFFRDVGAELTKAAGSGDERYAVLFNLPYCYGYYVDSPLVSVQRVTNPAKLEEWRVPEMVQLAEVQGIRYLWVRSEPAFGIPFPVPPAEPALDSYLERFPANDVPTLQQTLVLPPVDPIAALLVPEFQGGGVRITRARTFELWP